MRESAPYTAAAHNFSIDERIDIAVKIIKKYSNRRLYDTDASQYITQEELAEIIRKGHDVKVIDAKTEADLTQSVLAQIILESRGAAKLLPVPLLKQLIRMGDDALAEFMSQYVTWALEVYVQVKQGMRGVRNFNPFGNPFGMGFNPSNALARLFSMADPWNQGGGFGPFGGGPMPRSEAEQEQLREKWIDPVSDTAPAEEDVGITALRQEIQELRELLHGLSAHDEVREKHDEKDRKPKK